MEPITITTSNLMKGIKMNTPNTRTYLVDKIAYCTKPSGDRHFIVRTNHRTLLLIGGATPHEKGYMRISSKHLRALFRNHAFHSFTAQRHNYRIHEDQHHLRLIHMIDGRCIRCFECSKHTHTSVIGDE